MKKNKCEINEFAEYLSDVLLEMEDGYEAAGRTDRADALMDFGIAVREAVKRWEKETLTK